MILKRCLKAFHRFKVLWASNLENLGSAMIKRLLYHRIFSSCDSNMGLRVSSSHVVHVKTIVRPF